MADRADVPPLVATLKHGTEILAVATLTFVALGGSRLLLIPSGGIERLCSAHPGPTPPAVTTGRQHGG